MTFDECNDEYLVIGRDRRKDEGDLTRAYGDKARRRLMSRKGIGKLSGFGIANRVEVRTVRDHQVTHFALDYDRIIRSGKFVDEYEPELLPDDGETVKEQNGTEVKLTAIKISRAIPENQFRASMARRFTVLTDPGFRVYVNGKVEDRQEQAFQFRYPPEPATWETADIPGAGQARWWAGFREEPIRDEEARGIVVFARGRLAQAPWFFGLSGGVHGQHGMQYMTGEVQADFLDTTDGADLIATDRGTVLWDEAPAAALKDWGERKVRELLDEWAKGRQRAKITRPEVLKYVELAERLPPEDRRIFNEFVNRVTGIPQVDRDEEIVDELVRFGYNALTNHRFFELIRQLNAATPEDRDRVADILVEWDVIEVIQTFQKVRGRVEIIRKFDEMIAAGVPEKPDMHEFLKAHPWLIDIQWETLQHEKSLDTLLAKEFLERKTKSPEAAKRIDFFCLAASHHWEVVELKRPGETVGIPELDQTRDYVFFLREHARKTTDPKKQVRLVVGILVYSDIAPGTSEHLSALHNAGIYSRTWHDLLRAAEAAHREFLDVVRKRAPADDPRILELDSIEDRETGPSATA